jgi:ADP-ribose pyrophosphatase YjhB (NUDIX family)
MYLAAAMRDVEARYGTPRVLAWEAEFDQREFELLRTCLRKGRAHDVTLFIRDGERLALIRKPLYPAGLFRPPSGGVERGEPFEAGARREAFEETGLSIRLTRYLLRFDARFRRPGETVAWTTHVVAAEALTHDLVVMDRKEIAEACWGTPAAIHAVMRPRMLAWGSEGMRYRVAIQDEALAMLGHPLREPR